MAIAFAKGITVTAPGISTTSGGGGTLEVETYEIDAGSQEFEENNDIARNDDYVTLEKSQKKYGTLTISGKGTCPATIGQEGAISFTGPSGGTAPAPSPGYGIVTNVKNTVTARQKPTFSVTYQLCPNPSNSSGGGGGSSQGSP